MRMTFEEALACATSDWPADRAIGKRQLTEIFEELDRDRVEMSWICPGCGAKNTVKVPVKLELANG